MTRRSYKAVTLFGVAVLATLAWPGASTADTSLGGYSGVAQAEPVRIEIFEPVIPLPSDPQVDAGIGLTKSNTDTGPVSRALASYLWPGDVVGDGFDALTGHPGDTYPVQVNSRYPATTKAPANNTAQLTEGNGMTTSTDGTTTQATVNGLGITGQNPLSNPLGGICQILGGKKCTTAGLLPVPLPSTAPLLGLVQLENVYSQSTVVVGAKSVTATAVTHVSKLKLLGGLITVAGVDLSSESVSDGTKATTTGSSHIGGLTIAGTQVNLDLKTVSLGGTSGTLPKLPLDLSTLGIQLQYDENQRTVSGASSSLAAQGLILSVDTGVITKLLGTSTVTSFLQKLLVNIPGVGNEVAPLLAAHPKIVIQLGSVNTSVTAAPAYVPPSFPPPGGTVQPPPTVGTSPSSGLGGLTGTTAGTVTAPSSIQQTSKPPTSGPTIQTALKLPGLGKVPRWLIIGGLLLAGAIGWLFRYAAAFLLAGSGVCSYGLDTGVPDLRKG